jgi:hypothetical protein
LSRFRKLEKNKIQIMKKVLGMGKHIEHLLDIHRTISSIAEYKALKEEIWL